MFGRRKHTDSGKAITEFWMWWEHARVRVAAAITDGTVDSLAAEISARVKAIHKDLEWELTKGTQAQHSLVVAPAGEAALRPTVARWLALAPPLDATFEYFGSRQPDDKVFTSKMEIAGRTLELEQLRFAFTAEEDAHSIDVGVYHPEFAILPESAANLVTVLSLDWALGEERAELWLGNVQMLRDPVPDLRTALELRAVVAELAARHDEPVFAMLSAETKRGNPVLALVQVPLRQVRWPRFDTHVAVTMRYSAQSNGLPTDESLTELREIEDTITATLDSNGELVAHETSEGVRTLHIYVDTQTSAAHDATAAAVSTGSIKITTKVLADPSFANVRHLAV